VILFLFYLLILGLCGTCCFTTCLELKGYEKPSEHDGKALFAIEDDDDESSSRGNRFADGNGSQQQQLQSRQSAHSGVNQDIEQRTKEIDGIAQSISELADMFKDLGNLVLDQGTLLDRIDYNVEQMSSDIRGAAQELKTATQWVIPRSLLCLMPLGVLKLIIPCRLISDTRSGLANAGLFSCWFCLSLRQC
jgi:syntaxin 16